MLQSPEGILYNVFEPYEGPSRPGLLLDRDGVLNERIVDGYVLEPSQLRPNGELLDALAAMEPRVPVAIVTNQSCIGRGLLDRARFEEIMRRLEAQFTDRGLVLGGWFACPHRPQDDCACRKPRTALLLAAARDLHLQLERSVFVGDTESDATASQNAGVRAFIAYAMHDGVAAETVREIACVLHEVPWPENRNAHIA